MLLPLLSVGIQPAEGGSIIPLKSPFDDGSMPSKNAPNKLIII